MTTENSGKKNLVHVGIDIGGESTKVVLGSANGCEIVRNDVGGHTTPTAISFGSIQQPRQIGSTAQSKSAVTGLFRLLDGERNDGGEEVVDPKKKDASWFGKFDTTDDNFIQLNGMTDYTQQLGGDASSSLSSGFSTSTLLAMLLSNVQSSVEKTLQRITPESSDSPRPELEFDILIPPDLSEQAKQQLLDAVYATGLERARLVDVGEAYKACYQRKFPPSESTLGTSSNVLVVIDMGKTQTSVTVYGYKQGEESATDEDGGDDGDGEKIGEEKKQRPQLQVLSSVRNKSLGAGNVDIRLWDHFQSTVPALTKQDKINPNSRAGQRMLDGTKKLKHLLSQLPEGTVTVENIGENDTDVKLSLTRKVLADLCEAESKAIKALIQKALDGAGIVIADKKLSVEITGGGCRIPWVKQTILSAIGATDDSMLAYSMDDTSAALGAALYGEQQDQHLTNGNDDAKIAETETRKGLREAEESMKKLDQQLRAKADILNKIEAHVLELRSAKHDSKFGSLVPAAELAAYLDEVENWLFSEEADNASMDQAEAKWEETLNQTNEMAKDYLEAKEKEQASKDAEMEAEAKRAQAENEGNNDGEEDDHDNRRLPKKRRMEIVMKNKAEANELFGDGNYKFAAARYTKALSHCAKFVDLSPEDIEEVNGVKLSLNLNLALAYLKLENPDQALRVCNEAIGIDDSNTKALYRRASVYYEKKSWDLANKDVKAALKIAPDDKAVKKLQQKIEAQLQRQKQKEKKMAQKMFG